MSEIVLSGTTTSANQYVPAEYSSAVMAGDFNPMVQQQKIDSPTATATFDDGNAHHQQQSFYQDYGFQQIQMNYQAMPMAAAAYQMRMNGFHHPTSPADSISSSPQTPPSATSTASISAAAPAPTAAVASTASTTTATATAADDASAATTSAATAAAAAAAALNFSQLSVQPQPLDGSIPTTTTPLMSASSSATTFSNSTTERVKETIARANSVPMEFYHTEFLEYSKETYEKKMDAKRNKRKRSGGMHSTNSSSSDDLSSKKKREDGAECSDDDDLDEDDLDERNGGPSSAELRRQIHIQSEQKRRAQIKDGFDELRKHLPGCNNKKMSKAALLTRTVQQIQHLKNMQSELLAEVERLVQENDTLKKFQHGVLQRQAMEKMYTF